ncbi:MAG TPA: alpha/beta fold hydrolase [Stellaceae bacterium]|nr:alpha/beta fold hydrolase [Stellaceae bacterium]
MIETRNIETAPGLVFDASLAGTAPAPLVLMLHGFCVSRHYWDNQLPVLAAAGYFAVAPNQRGYAAGARPDPAIYDHYRIDKLIDDALAIVSALGYGERPFHLVGHDWGGSLSWIIADRWPERLASLTMLSRPHPASFARAMQTDPEQPHRSRHHHELLDPGAGPRLLADNGKWVRDRLRRNGVPAAAIDKHLGVIGNPPAMEAALAWYRARGERQPVGPTRVPTLFIWGEADDTVGRIAAEGTAEFIAAEYRFAPLAGVGHYAADQVPARVNELLLDHLARHPPR